MKKKIFNLLAIASLFSATICFGGEVFQAGGITFYTGDDGRTAISYQAGGTTFYRDSEGNTAISYKEGKTTFFHYNPPPQCMQGQGRGNQELYLEFQRKITNGGLK